MDSAEMDETMTWWQSIAVKLAKEALDTYWNDYDGVCGWELKELSETILRAAGEYDEKRQSYR